MDYQHFDMHESRCIYAIEHQIDNFAPWYTFVEGVSDQEIYFKFVIRYAAWKDIPFETVCDFLGINGLERAHWYTYYSAIQDCSDDFSRMVEHGPREEKTSTYKGKVQR